MNLLSKSFRRVIMLMTITALTVVLSNSCSTGSMDGGPSSNNGTLFDSEHVSSGSSFSFTFSNDVVPTDTTIDYFCEIHAPDMKGSVIVSSDANISGQDTVIMENKAYNPAQITIQPGTKIVWVNNDGFDHTITNGTPSSDSNGGGYRY